MQRNYIVTVDFGGTKILSALVEQGGEIIARVKYPTDVKKGKAYLMNSLTDSVREVIKEGGISESDLKAVCVGVPGSVDPYKATIGIAPNLDLKNFNIGAALTPHFSVPVVVENDVNLAALGIQHFELKEKGRNVLVVFVGTGIGGALLFDGKLYRGSRFFAGEIGHITIDPQGPKCGCGKKGCLEAIASRTAIAREIKKDLKLGKKSILNELLPRGKQIKSKVLQAAVKKNDPVVIKHITEACQNIGFTIGNIANLLNIDTVVLGGGVVEALNKFMIPIIKEAFQKTALKDAAKGMKISATKLGDDAALYGGISLAEEFGYLQPHAELLAD